jgi:hypothetical protein
MLYVGKARSLRRRLRGYFLRESGEPGKHAELLRSAWSLSWRETGSELEALLLEQGQIVRFRPPLNRQVRVHRRPRGAWREARCFCVLPSSRPGHVEVCLVSGTGLFHWESVPGRPVLPRGLWGRVASFLEGVPGWSPDEPGRLLSVEEAGERAEIALAWLARRGDGVSRIDLPPTVSRADLRRRARRLLGEDPRAGRVQMR